MSKLPKGPLLPTEEGFPHPNKEEDFNYPGLQRRTADAPYGLGLAALMFCLIEGSCVRY